MLTITVIKIVSKAKRDGVTLFFPIVTWGQCVYCAWPSASSSCSNNTNNSTVCTLSYRCDSTFHTSNITACTCHLDRKANSQSHF